MARVQARLRFSRPGFGLDLDLDLPGTGVTAVFGRSGAGKTTLLRLLAGLERGVGRLQVLGETYQDSAARIFVPTHRRAVGYVFQEASLFPHLTVRGNLEYAARRRNHRAGPSPPEPRGVAETLGLASLLDRSPAGLSGGERQRVAIARALLASPRLLLMDEPLAALDVRSRAEIFPYLERLRDVFALPIVYVSHALDEIARLADHVVVIEHGAHVAAGPVADILSRLALAEVFADDASTVIDGVIGLHDAEDHLSRLDFGGRRSGDLVGAHPGRDLEPGGSLWVDAVGRPVGARARARVLARDVSLTLGASSPSSILNVLPATVLELADAGPSRVTVRLALAGGTAVLVARITRRSCGALGLRPGLAVTAQVKTVAVLT